MDDNPHAYLFVDGSSTMKQDVGAWAAIAATMSCRKVLYGVTYPTTISRCELIPIIEGLRWIRENWARKTTGFRVSVYSDSEYTVKTLSGLYQRNKNLDLWHSLDFVALPLQMTYIWRERNTLDYMEFCDALCGGLRKTVIQTLKESTGNAYEIEKVMPFEALPTTTTAI